MGNRAISINQKKAGNIREKYCKCGCDKKMHSGSGTTWCKSCNCEEYEFGQQRTFKAWKRQ